MCTRVHTCVRTYVDSIGYPVVEFLQGRQTTCLIHGLYVAVFKTSCLLVSFAGDHLAAFGIIMNERVETPLTSFCPVQLGSH